jgi:glycosyltransferase involved in cell wall biosynthesis
MSERNARDGVPAFRLAIFSDSPLRGGAEVSIATCLRELSPSIDVVVMGVDPGVVGWIADHRPGAERWVVPAVRGKWDFRSIAAQWRAVRAIRPDIFQPNLISPSACRYAIVAALLTRGVRVVALEHLAVHTDAWTQRRIKQLSARFFAAHIAVGEKAARVLEQESGRPPGAIRVIHNGVADRPLAQAPRFFPGPTVGTIGRLDPQKGHDVLLRSLADLPGVSAVVVGDGPAQLELSALANELGISERVVFAGRRDDARELLTTFDVFALPSRFEGFPLVLLEAMLARLAVVATDVGSVTEAVVDGETGLVVAPDDPAALTAAIRSLLEAPDARRTFGEAGRARALGFSPGRMARDFEALYEAVLDDQA